MLIRRKVQTALAAVLLSAAVPGYVSAQLPGVTPDVIQKARQSGATEEQIQQALGGMSVPGTPQSGTNAGAGKSATGSADRKALDQKVLRDLNPTKVSGVDTLTWNQVLSNDWQLQQQQQRILQSMTTPYQDPEFEVLWEDGKFVRRPIPKVFGPRNIPEQEPHFRPQLQHGHAALVRAGRGRRDRRRGVGTVGALRQAENYPRRDDQHPGRRPDQPERPDDRRGAEADRFEAEQA